MYNRTIFLLFQMRNQKKLLDFCLILGNFVIRFENDSFLYKNVEMFQIHVNLSYFVMFEP